VKRVLLTLALLALSAPGAAQQAPTISPGGGRAEARAEARAEVRTGVASYYAASLHGRLTANGERYDHRGALTAAHKTLPFGTLLRVKSEHNGRAVLVRVNDRGPFVRGRVLDLSGAAADRLRMRQRGLHRVRYEIVDPATLPSRQPRPPRKVRHI
jgi:rare lipoprotein A